MEFEEIGSSVIPGRAEVQDDTQNGAELQSSELPKRLDHLRLAEDRALNTSIPS